MISPAHPSFFLEITKSPGRQPLAGRLQAAASSVRVIFQSVFQHRAVLCPLGIPTHAINQTLPRCCSQVNSSTTEHKRTPNSLYNNKTQIIPRRFPSSNNLLCCIYLSNCVVYYSSLWRGRESWWLTCLGNIRLCATPTCRRS